MKKAAKYRGPSKIDSATMNEAKPSRAVANVEKEEDRNVRAVAQVAMEEEKERNVESVEEETTMDPKERNVESSPKEEKNEVPERKAGNAFKTICDVDIHPDDKMYAYPGSSRWLRIVGSGVPKVIPVGTAASRQGPCVNQVYKVHENEHVKNARSYCANFKKCLDSKLGYISKTLYYSDFVSCHNANHGGLDPNCRTDEQSAYRASAAEAARLSAEASCAGEKSLLDKAAIEHGQYAISPPNC